MLSIRRQHFALAGMVPAGFLIETGGSNSELRSSPGVNAGLKSFSTFGAVGRYLKTIFEMKCDHGLHAAMKETYNFQLIFVAVGCEMWASIFFWCGKFLFIGLETFLVSV